MEKRLGHMPVTLNNRITLPKPVMKRLGATTDDILGFYEHPDGVLIRKLKLVDSD